MIKSIPILVLLVGCASAPTFEPLPCPPRPDLENISIEEQMEVPSDVLLKFARNQLKLKKQVVLLEKVSGCNDQ